MKRHGFTLVEMTIVLFIISLLVLIILPNIGGQRKRAAGIHQRAMQTVVQGQIDAYLDDHPEQHTVTYLNLTTADYLTIRQVKQAQDEGLTIRDNQVRSTDSQQTQHER